MGSGGGDSADRAKSRERELQELVARAAGGGPRLAEGITVASRFRLDRRLGTGGMGQVWAATHTITEHRHALKLLRRSHSTPQARERFMREARAASRVSHPNVIAIQDVFELEDGSPVMVMDLLEGETLRRLLEREETLELGEAADLMLPVVAAISAAHGQGVVHRDLKPENIFIVPSAEGADRVRVLDFGIAELPVPEEDGDSVTETGQLLGTPLYMAPEQLLGDSDVDGSCDVWALGVILYEALSGGRPYEATNVGQMTKAILEEGRTPLAELRPDLPEALERVIDGALARDRSERPSLEEMAAALRPHAGSAARELRIATDREVFSEDEATEAGGRVDALRAAPKPPSPSPDADTDGAPSSRSRDLASEPNAAPAPAKSPSPRTWAWLAAAGVLVLAWMLWPGDDAPAPARAPAAQHSAGTQQATGMEPVPVVTAAVVPPAREPAPTDSWTAPVAPARQRETARAAEPPPHATVSTPLATARGAGGSAEPARAAASAPATSTTNRSGIAEELPD